MSTIKITKGEAIRRGTPSMAGKRARIIRRVQGHPDVISYMVEWPGYPQGLMISRAKETQSWRSMLGK